VNQPREFAVTGSRAFSAEGARIAVMSCLACGAALVIDPGDDVNVAAIHREWHAARGEVAR
jgi:hypothetical protein